MRLPEQYLRTKRSGRLSLRWRQGNDAHGNDALGTCAHDNDAHDNDAHDPGLTLDPLTSV